MAVRTIGFRAPAIVLWLAVMLTIRSEQMLVFSDAARTSFLDRTAAHLMRALPEACAELGIAAVRQSVADGLAKARSYGIETEYDVVRFIDFMYVMGFEFDAQDGWAREILANRRIPAQVRLDMIDERLDEPEPEAGEAAGG